MPKPLESLLGAKARITCNSIVPRTFAQNQYPEQRSLPSLTLKTKVILWIAEVPTYFPYNQTASRFLDRACSRRNKGGR